MKLDEVHVENMSLRNMRIARMGRKDVRPLPRHHPQLKLQTKRGPTLLYIEDNFALTNVADRKTGYNSVKPVSKSRIYHLHNLHHVVKGKE